MNEQTAQLEILKKIVRGTGPALAAVPTQARQCPRRARQDRVKMPPLQQKWRV